MCSQSDKASRQKCGQHGACGLSLACSLHQAALQMQMLFRISRLLIQALCVGEDAQQAETSSPQSAAADSDSGDDWGEVQEASADAEPTLAAASPPVLQPVCEESLQVCPALAACLDRELLTAASAWLHEGPGTWR